MVFHDEKVEKVLVSKSCWGNFRLHGYLVGPWTWPLSTTNKSKKRRSNIHFFPLVHCGSLAYVFSKENPETTQGKPGDPPGKIQEKGK